MIGKVLEKYQILDKVGQGGMAVVYRGLDTTLGREVAVKVLHPHLAELEESRLRLQREAQAVAKLRHENILEIFAYSGLDSPESYIVTEFIHGRTLKELLKDHPIPHPEVAGMIVHEVCQALKHAHSLGVIHRDIKPENVMIRDDGLVKLTDFGIAQIIDKERMTVTGQLLGSPAYMAPEQVEGKPADFRSDVFSVGILLYQLATGDLPFRGKNPHEVLKKIADCKYLDPEIARPEVGARLSRIIGRALKRDPAARPADIGTVLEEIRGYLSESGIAEPQAELKKFFTDPVGYSADFRPRLIAALTERGEAALAARMTPQALELFNRVLTVDPGNTRVARSLARLSRRQRWTRTIIYAAGVLLLLGAGAATARLKPWRAWTARPTPPPVAIVRALTPADAGSPDAAAGARAGGPPPVADAGPAAVAARPAVAADAAPRVPRSHVAPPGRRLSPPGRRLVAAPAAVRRVILDVFPRTATASVALDGRSLGAYRPGEHLPLGPGQHIVTVSAPGFYPELVPLPATDTRTRLTVRLRWKPAQIVVQCDAPGAAVRVSRGNDRKDALPGATVHMKVPAESENGEFTVLVSVSAPGYRSASTTITVRAGHTRSVTVPLRKAD